MRYVPWMLSASLIVACAGELSRPVPTPRSAPSPGAPGVPDPRPSAKASLWLVVADRDSYCIPGGSIRVVDGQLAGETRVQDQLPCSVWDYGMGISLSGLEPGVKMTITASAPGYAEQSETFYPNAFGGGAFFFTLVPR